jgi:hypothetical protein
VVAYGEAVVAGPHIMSVVSAGLSVAEDNEVAEPELGVTVVML